MAHQTLGSVTLNACYSGVDNHDEGGHLRPNGGGNSIPVTPRGVGRGKRRAGLRAH